MSGLVLEGLSGEIVKQVTARILLNSLLPCFPLSAPLDQFCFCDIMHIGEGLSGLGCVF